MNKKLDAGILYPHRNSSEYLEKWDEKNCFNTLIGGRSGVVEVLSLISRLACGMDEGICMSFEQNRSLTGFIFRHFSSICDR